MQRIALKVQNVLDEIASFAERGLGVVTWADPNASAIFLLIAIAAALAIAALGLHTVLAVALCWLVRAALFLACRACMHAALPARFCTGVCAFSAQAHACCAFA
jgi:hypothetical protein